MGVLGPRGYAAGEESLRRFQRGERGGLAVTLNTNCQLDYQFVLSGQARTQHGVQSCRGAVRNSSPVPVNYANGRPPLHSGIDSAEWAREFQSAYDDLCRRVDGGEDTLIDPYAT